MATISALLKSAAATQAKIQTANDAEVAYEWGSSQQTYDDYLAYNNYLQSQAAKTTDPTQALSYQTKSRAALVSYQSNEIQRQSQAIQEGNASIQDKQGVIQGLIDQAYAIGDENQVQNLVSQWDSLSIQAQNQAQALLSAGNAASAKATTDFKNQVSDTVDQYKNLQKTFVSAFTNATTPAEQAQNIAKINANLPANLQVDPAAGIFDIVASIDQAIAGDGGILQQAIQLAPDDATRRTYQEQFDGYANGTTPVATLPGTNGKNISLTLQDVQKQVAAANVGQTLYSPVSGANGTEWNVNTLDNYKFGRDANGNTVAVPTYSTGGMDLSVPVNTSDGQAIKINGKDATYKSLLQKYGFNVSESGGSLIVNDPSGKGRLNGNNTVQAYVDSNGQLQFADNENNIFSVNFDKDGNYTGTQHQTANPFIQTNADGSKNENSPYFQANPNQYRETQGTAGLLTPQTVAQFDVQSGINKNPSVTGGGFMGAAPRFSTPTTVLQNANLRQGAMTAPLQAPQLVTSPVPQIQAPSLNPNAISSRANITVTPQVAPQATISTTPVNSNPNVTVQKKAPTFNITF